MPDNDTQDTSPSQTETGQPEAPAGPPLPLIDVIIPVYCGLEETRACLSSVLIHPQSTPFELVVVNDSSPEPEITAYLEELAAGGSITLLSNEVNIGFVDSVNLGMMLHPDRDVVILNSDTEVSGDWLDRLRGAARSAPDIATVTPFSNNSTLTSYPRYMHANPLPADAGAAELDALFQEVNAGRYVEIPTAVGFCTFITRRSLEQVGYLDSLHFGQGYGEENDFSMRARAAGFRHLLAGDTFVFHRGGASFGSEAGARSQAAQETLRRLHPDYEPLVGEHCVHDPERPLRRRVDIARLARLSAGRLLFVSHRLGGGTEKHIRDLVRMLGPDWEVLVLRPSGPGEVSLEWAREGEEFAAFFRLPGEYGELVAFLKAMRVSRVHVHHFVELPPETLELFSPAALRVPLDVTIHDYYTICPFTNLVDTSGDYCGEPSLEECDACFAARRPAGEVDPRQRRQRAARLLEAAERVFVPSQDALKRMTRYFPKANYLFMPHPEAETEPLTMPAPSGGEIRVLVLGELSPAKGLWLLEACAEDAAARGLPLEFRALGRPLGRVRQEPELPLSFSGPYQDSRLAEMIERERPRIIFFPARWPETWSYTLSTAMRTGLPVAAPRLGAFPERLQDYHAAHLMDWDTGAAGWNDLFMSLAQEPARSSHGA